MSKSIKDTPEQAEFRAYCKEWLADNVPAKPDFRLPQTSLEIMTTEQLDYLVAWEKAAYDAGLVGCDYPKEYGGGGRTGCQRIANQEMKSLETPFLPNYIGLGMAAPTILYHASEELKTRLLPRLLSGEDIWCQGFSEPGAGSDLSSVKCSAERKGDKWIINGHKVWTTIAHFAEWMILLARSDKNDRYNGLSYFVVPIRENLDKGVEVRPLIKMTGETGFNEVIFTDVEVPDAYRLDEVGAGWKVAMTTLTHERGAGPMVTPASGKSADSSDKPSGAYALIDLAKQTVKYGKSAADDPMTREKIMQLVVRQEAIKQAARLSYVKPLIENPARVGLANKLVRTEMKQASSELGWEIEGMAGSLYIDDPLAPNGGQNALTYMNSFGGTIAGGTSEVQKNILGERVLGLAKSK